MVSAVWFPCFGLCAGLRSPVVIPCPIKYVIKYCIGFRSHRHYLALVCNLQKGGR